MGVLFSLTEQLLNLDSPIKSCNRYPWVYLQCHGQLRELDVRQSPHLVISVSIVTPIWIDQMQVGQMCGFIKGATHGFAI